MALRYVSVDDTNYRMPDVVMAKMGEDARSLDNAFGQRMTQWFSPLTVDNQRSVRNRDLVVDVVAEGADPTGAVASQTVLASSLDLLPAAGGTVFLRPGSYRFSTRLISTRQGVVIQGAGMDATTLLLDSAAFQVGSSDVLVRDLTIKGNGANYRSVLQLVTTGQFKNWRFENVRFEGCGLNPKRIGAVDNTGTALTIGTGLANHIEIVDCEFLSYTEDGALRFDGIDHFLVSRCWFHDSGTDVNKGDMLKMSNGSQYGQVIGNRFENGTRDAIDCYDGQRILIEGNVVVGMGAHGIEMKVTNFAAPNPADRMRVANNQIRDIGRTSAAPAIQGATSNLVITGNEIAGGPAYGIRLGKVNDQSANSRDSLIVGNHVSEMGTHGIAALGVDGVAISGNVSVSNTGSGFYIDPAVNTSVAGSASLNVSRLNGAADVW